MPEICCLSHHSAWGKQDLLHVIVEPLRKLLKQSKKLEKWSKTKYIYDETIVQKSFDTELMMTSTYINFNVENNDRNP